jgi:competence protein ComEA
MSKKVKTIVLVTFVLVFIIFGFLVAKPKQTQVIIPEDTTDIEVEHDVVVEVKGEVNRPGLYFLNSNSRVNDAIILAGGFTIHAQTNTINLALKVSDGMVIFVPKNSETNIENKISINKATLSELMMISGIGEVKARSIIAYRNSNGKFNSIEELLYVEGISQKLFDQIKDDICI